MKAQIDDALARALGAWIDAVGERTREIVAVILLVTLGLGIYTALFLGVNSDCEITDRAGHPAILCLDDGQGGPNDPRSTRNSSQEEGS